MSSTATARRKKLDANILKPKARSIFKNRAGKGEAPRDVQSAHMKVCVSL